MPRVRKGAARRQAKKRILKAVKGHRNPRGQLYRLAKEAATRAEVNARIDRRRKKRDFRNLWVIRLNAESRSTIPPASTPSLPRSRPLWAEPRGNAKSETRSTKSEANSNDPGSNVPHGRSGGSIAYLAG